MRAASLALAAAALAACSGAQTKLGAAEDVRAFIIAVRENDQATFERHVDREALRTQLLGQVAEQAGPFAGALGSPFAQQAADQLIRPESFRAALERSGAPSRTPTAPEIATQLRVVDDGRVCLPRSPNGPCAITFAEQGQNWRLVAIDVSDVSLADGGFGPGSPPAADPTAP